MIVFRCAQEVSDWMVIFHEATGEGWLEKVTPGVFKHVSLVAWAPQAQVWVYLDVRFGQTKLILLPNGERAEVALGEWSKGATIVKFRAHERKQPTFRGFFSCVASAAHMLGVPLCVWATPDRLYRALVSEGGEVIYDARRRRQRHGHDDDGHAGATAGADRATAEDCDAKSGRRDPVERLV